MVSALCDMHARFVKIKRGTKQPIDKWAEQAKPYLKSEIDQLAAAYNIGVVADDHLVFLIDLRYLVRQIYLICLRLR